MKFDSFVNKKKFTKILFWLGISLFAVIGLCSAIVYFNSDKIKQTFIKELNKHLLTEVKVKDIDIGWMSSFPLVSVSFSQISIADAYKDTTLNQGTMASLSNLSLKFNLIDVLSGSYNIRKIEAEKGQIKLRILNTGDCNYEFWKSDTSSSDSEFSFSIKKIQIKDIALEYHNDISKMFVSTKVFKATASGEFSSQYQSIDIVSDLNVKSFAYDNLQMQSNIPIHIDIEAENNTLQGLLSTTESIIQVGDMKFAMAGKMNYKEALNIDCSVIAKQIQLSEALSLLKLDGKEIFEQYKADGMLQFAMNINGELAKDKMPQIKAEYNLDNASVYHKNKNIRIKNVNLKGSYTNGENKNSTTSELNVDSFSADFNNNFLKGHFQLKDFHKLYIDASIGAKANLGEVKDLIKQDSLEVLSGKVSVDLKAKGELKKLRMKGSASLENFAFKDKRLPSVVLDKTNCELTFDNDKIHVFGAKGRYFAQPFELTANYILNGKLSAEAKLKRYELSKITLNDIEAKLTYDKNVIDCSYLKFSVFDGWVLSKSCKVLFDQNTTTANGVADLTNINLQKAFAQTKNFNQQVLTDKNVNGTLSAKAKFNLYFDKDFNLQLDKSTITTDYTLNQGRLKNVQILEKLSLFVDEAALKDVKFETISSSIQIKNGSILLNPISVQSNILNFNFAGTHGLNGAIDYNISVKLSELASKRKKAAMQKQQQQFGSFENSSDNRITLFVKVKGTTDNPIFSYDIKGNILKASEKLNKDRQEVLKALDKDFNLRIEESKKQREQWERQQAGEFIIEWEEPETKQENKDKKQFEEADFSVEWE